MSEIGLPSSRIASDHAGRNGPRANKGNVHSLVVHQRTLCVEHLRLGISSLGVRLSRRSLSGSIR